MTLHATHRLPNGLHRCCTRSWRWSVPGRSPFKTNIDLYLPELPPPGEAQLVVEWPDEGIKETHTSIDAAALVAASATALDIWPGLEPPDPAEQPETFPHDASTLAYAAAAAGLRISNAQEAVNRRSPRRWVELPSRLRR